MGENNKKREQREGKNVQDRMKRADTGWEIYKEKAQDVFAVKLLKKMIFSTGKGQTHILCFLFRPLNECMGRSDRLMQPSPVTLPSHQSPPHAHTHHRTSTHYIHRAKRRVTTSTQFLSPHGRVRHKAKRWRNGA